VGSGGSGVSKRQRASMVWFKQRLLEEGFVTTGQQRDSLNFILGPLHVQGTATMIKPRALVNNRDRMTPGKDRAFALITSAHLPPDSSQGQVQMSLESFTQMVVWLLQGDTSRFLRDIKRREGKDG